MKQELREKEEAIYIEIIRTEKGEVPFIPWEGAKSRVFPKLVNTQRNLEMISGMAHREILDLTVVYDIELMKNDAFRMALPVTKDIFRRWEITEDELFETAFCNMEEKNGPVIEDFYTAQLRVLRMIGIGDDDKSRMILKGFFLGESPVQDAKESPFYILNSSDYRCGAVFLASPSALKSVAEIIEDDFLLLPSSVHEVLILRKQDGFDLNDLAGIVRSVNRACVPEEDQLSDHVYCYEKGELRIIA